MRVLIVEDNAFNAYCLRRLLESVAPTVNVIVVNNSKAALAQVSYALPDMMVIDGDLGASNDVLYFNGPELAHILLEKNPQLPLIAWSASETMHQSFAKVFQHHAIPLTEYNNWSKGITQEHIDKTWSHYFGTTDRSGKATSSYLRQKNRAFDRNQANPREHQLLLKENHEFVPLHQGYAV